jgi:hypothetical protein
MSKPMPMARRAAPTKSAFTRSMSALVMARGIWLSGM